MQAIIAPISLGDSDANVANLQDALRLLLDRCPVRAFVLNGEITTWRTKLRNALIEAQPT